VPRARIALALALLAPVAALAQRTLADSLPTGRVLDSLVSRADAGEHYAVYLPSTYSSTRRWPLLVLMDPRGRALIPLERFRPIAERLGYLVASSYETRSDGAENPNPRAVDAIIEDAERFLSLDARRVYLVGFSGTARAAWMMSEPLVGTVAGIVGVGAGLPASAEWLQSHVHGIDGHAPFVVFATAGTFDPNYEEVRALGPALDRVGIPHRWEAFEGSHAWPPETVCAHAVEWLELQAMRRGLAEPRAAWIDSLA
jgi:predicted esterase